MDRSYGLGVIATIALLSFSDMAFAAQPDTGGILSASNESVQSAEVPAADAMLSDKAAINTLAAVDAPLDAVTGLPLVPQEFATLPAGTPVIVMLNEELSTNTNEIGDRFTVTVLHDVVDGETVVIPQGTTGYGDVTFRTGKGGFGKAGILGISLRNLEMNGRLVALDGRYREEGGNNNGAVAATWLAVGVFSGFIKGKSGVIPQGRELKARTDEDIEYIVDAVTSEAEPATADAGDHQGAEEAAATEPAPETASRTATQTITQ